MGSANIAEMLANRRDTNVGDDTSACSITEGELGRLLDECFDAPASLTSATHHDLHGHRFSSIEAPNSASSFANSLHNLNGTDFHCHEAWLPNSIGDLSFRAESNVHLFNNFDGYSGSVDLIEQPHTMPNIQKKKVGRNAIAKASPSCGNFTFAPPFQPMTVPDVGMPNVAPTGTCMLNPICQDHRFRISTHTKKPSLNINVLQAESSPPGDGGKHAAQSRAVVSNWSTKPTLLAKGEISSLHTIRQSSSQRLNNSFVSQQTQSIQSLPIVSSFQELSNEVAYERKKTRAKNARMMINESIDKISVAISAAGMQSKERHDQIVQIEQEKDSLFLKNIMEDFASQRTASSPSSVADYSHVKSVLTNCVAIAEGAKKWDRPSFMESSASMVQAMDAQCESLMRELVSCHEQIMEMTKYIQQIESKSLPQVTKNSFDLEPQLGNLGLQERILRKAGKHALNENNLESNIIKKPSKRYRVVCENDSNQVKSIELRKDDIISAVMAERKVMNCIMQYLDTATKAKCLLRVSKSWKRGEYFDIDPLWCDMCSTRLLSSNTATDVHTHDKLKRVPCLSSSETMFWRMYTAKVMPRFFKSSNMVYLGEGQIAGKALGWTFLVEPSNSETTRSVRPPPRHLLKGQNLASDETTLLPVVTLWTIVQNVAIAFDEPIIIRDQIVTVDSSTRRRKDEMKEIYWDVSYKKRLLNLDGNSKEAPELSGDFVSADTFAPCAKCGNSELCHLKLFDAVIIETNIYAKGCATTSKFLQRSNYIQLLIQVPLMTTMPLVIRFDKDSSST
jgi:hypothetical protein